MVVTTEVGDPTASEDASRSADYPIPGVSCAKVIIDYTPEGDYSENQLKLVAGNIIYVHAKHSSGWWGGHKAGCNVTGWFPACVVEVPGQGEDGNEADTNEEVSEGRNERCLMMSSPNRSPLVTDDKRAVASPQMHVRASASPKGSTGSAAASEAQVVQQHGQQLEKDLESERRASKELRDMLTAAREHNAASSATIERLQAENSRLTASEAEARLEAEKMRDVVAMLQAELEALRASARMELEAERQSAKEAQERLETQEAQIRAFELQQAASTSTITSTSTTHSHSHGHSHSNNKAAMKASDSHSATAVGAQARSHTPVTRPEPLKASTDARPSPRLMACDPATKRPESSRGRDDGKHHHPHAYDGGGRSASASSSVPRRLFAHNGLGEDAGQARLAGQQHQHHGGAAAMHQARYIPVSANGQSASHVAALSSQAHGAAPPRPTPRGLHPSSGTAWTGRTHYVSAGQPGMQGQVMQASGSTSPRAMRGHGEGGGTSQDRMPAVRKLVSEFERRSTSQTPGVQPRSLDPSPSRRAQATTTCTGPSTPNAATRVASAGSAMRRPSPRMEAEAVDNSPSEDHSIAPLIIGMSPMPRAVPVRASPGMASSPVHGPSVQDRIRQLQGS